MSVHRQDLLSQARFLSFYRTPAYISRIEGAERINAELKSMILARARQPGAGRLHSNVGGWHSSEDLLRWGGEPIRTLSKHWVELANRLTVDRRGRPQIIPWRISCWANVNRRGHANRRHSHPGCFWSGTYYVDDGADGSAADLAGQLEFQDPRGVAAALATQQVVDEALLEPEAGLMVLFPSWLPHAVRPYGGASVRISIAFNLALAGQPA